MGDGHIYFWEPMVSPHKLDLFNSLSRRCEVEATWYVAQEELPLEKRREGWSVANIHARNLIIAPSRDRIREIVALSAPQSIHVFSGVHWVPCIVDGLKAAMEMGRRFGFMREPRASEGLKGGLRIAHSWLTEGRARRKADFVLAIGRNGPSWFKAVGYREEKIFPFAYFLPAPAARKCRDNPHPVRVSFLGRLETSKGIDLFLEAVQSVKHAITIDIAGTGRGTDLVRNAAAQSRIALTYHGAISMETVPDFLEATDILVLPSITDDDGWGAVVSEALMAGAAVIATDRVGASVCIADKCRGRVVHDLNAQSLAEAIDCLIADGCLSADHRAQRSAWARSCLTGGVGAEYMLAIFAHIYEGKQRPAPFYAR